MPRGTRQRRQPEPEIVDLTDTPSTTQTKKRKRSEDEQDEPAKRQASVEEEEEPMNESPAEQPAHTRIGAMSCIICMENYTNATVAHCGHIFCHECLIRALAASERNANRGIGVCPSCRKPISRRKANQIIPINFMKKSKFKKRKS